MKSNKGVSLVELSVVLAVIGLLLAAVVAGLGVKKSAELRGILTEVGGFQNAIEGFYAKYGAFPGDMPDAHTYWDNGANGVCGTAAQCNGDNDGQIELNASDGADSETFRAWQHLTLSESLEGSFSGVATTSIDQADIGINVPASKRAGVGYNIVYANTGDGSRNEIMVGAFRSTEVNRNAALTPVEALTIDRKLDDGVPATGIVHGINAPASTCISAGAYNIALDSLQCTQTYSARP